MSALDFHEQSQALGFGTLLLMCSFHKFSLFLPAIPVPLVELTKGYIEDSTKLHVFALSPDVVVGFEFIFKHPHLLLGELPALFLLVDAII